jgi:Leucine-rich repeat (LRR) protein
LEELRIDRNALRELPASLQYLKRLKSLFVAHNKLEKLPAFMVEMRTHGLVVS